MLVEYRGSFVSSTPWGPWNESPGNCEASAANPEFMDPLWIRELSTEATSGGIIIAVPISDFGAVGSLPHCDLGFAPNATSPGAYFKSVVFSLWIPLDQRRSQIVNQEVSTRAIMNSFERWHITI